MLEFHVFAHSDSSIAATNHPDYGLREFKEEGFQRDTAHPDRSENLDGHISFTLKKQRTNKKWGQTVQFNTWPISVWVASPKGSLTLPNRTTIWGPRV